MTEQAVKTVILSCGVGYNLTHILDAFRFEELPGIELTAVITDDPACFALERARLNSVEGCAVERAMFPSQKSFDKALFDKIDDLDSRLVVCADWPYPLSREILQRWENAVIYPWPSLLPAFGDPMLSPLEIQKRILADGECAAGVSACLFRGDGAPDRVLEQTVVEILPEDTPEALLRRIWQEGAGIVLPKAMNVWCAGQPDKTE